MDQKNKRLGYFTSVEVPKELIDAFKSLEDILQSQHGVDGKHPVVNNSQDGFMTANDKRKLDELISGTVNLTTTSGGSSSTITVDDMNAQILIWTGW